MILEWLPAALFDFDALIDYIAEENPAAAIAQGDTIEARISVLPAHPGSAGQDGSAARANW